MPIITILLYAVAIYMIFRTMTMSKRTKKNRILIDAMHSIQDEDVFFEKINALIDNEQGLFKGKAQTIKLWGMVYHQRLIRFQEVLDEINVDSLMLRDKNGNISIQNDEDTFVYLYLAIPEMLYSNGNLEEREMMKEKLKPYEDIMKNQIVCALSEAMDRCFEDRDDKGLGFCENLLSGEYGGYVYSKSMIGLYKSIAATQAAKVYADNNETEKYEELVPMIQDFAQSGIGARWVKGLHLNIPTALDEDSEDEEEETEEVNEETEVSSEETIAEPVEETVEAAEAEDAPKEADKTENKEDAE